ncbi:MAG: hypothetical protein H7A23_12245 [Leptospiraceae bacterium]|nr:hypothetical protein [Leptospiraceae bacterium]MCP5495318.1 hypothetical protein [Leptospiraceae bacterium]
MKKLTLLYILLGLSFVSLSGESNKKTLSVKQKTRNIFHIDQATLRETKKWQIYTSIYPWSFSIARNLNARIAIGVTWNEMREFFYKEYNRDKKYFFVADPTQEGRGSLLLYRYRKFGNEIHDIPLKGNIFLRYYPKFFPNNPKGFPYSLYFVGYLGEAYGFLQKKIDYLNFATVPTNSIYSKYNSDLIYNYYPYTKRTITMRHTPYVGIGFGFSSILPYGIYLNHELGMAYLYRPKIDSYVSMNIWSPTGGDPILLKIVENMEKRNYPIHNRINLNYIISIGFAF